MKKNFSVKLITVVAALVLIVCIIMLLRSSGCDIFRGIDDDDPVIYPTIERQSQSPQDATAATSEQPVKVPYVSPINWADEQEKNSEIYAWIYIPGTEISYPVVQSEKDDYYYEEHSAYKREYSGGAIFSDKKYNTKTFEDPVNILYGHKMRSGAMLGTLQTIYSTKEGFDSHREVIIYLPDKELHYKVWATTPFGNYNLMETFDFENAARKRLFLRTVLSKRAIEKQIDTDMEVADMENVLVLSTCLMGKVSQRYLLVASLDYTEE